MADALNVGTRIPASSAQFGKVMSEIKPPFAVGYYFFGDVESLPAALEMARKTYDGPLEMAKDYTVFNS